MKKQKICIIGGGLTGLVTAISLSGLNCEIDLIIGSGNQNIESNGTTAISQENLDFIQELNISASLKKNIWIKQRKQKRKNFIYVRKFKNKETYDEQNRTN